MTPAEIRTARAAAHRARARDFAEAHGIPEAALVAAFVGPGAVAIEAAPDRLMPLAAALGEALALTRNASAVQERQGSYERYDPCEARVAGPEIELHIFPEHWVHAFAVTEETAKAAKRSIQIFDAAGEAVHKIHLTPESDLAAFDRLVEALRLPDQADALPFAPAAAPAAGTGTAGCLGLAPEAVTQLLERAAAGQVPLGIRVGNAGCLQVFRGTVERILPAGYWINVMDPRFNLHLRTDHLAEVRLLRAQDGGLSVEAIHPDGSRIALIDGSGPEWEALAMGLPHLPD
ncbi:ChuX/HutX family heme-like substrate-binding protein [Rhodobacter sp. CZR27]|uniref:ChuX/HutX family heme-like substrate-binding protein n=1 Tax=Rhodobacter sp. CZR27 TaxID=2033869 RepID=UPI000BBE2B2D|nr:ChuX/HutX family heme-like substrate-binding protein [Rhodobacter sp. CZR27]